MPNFHGTVYYQRSIVSYGINVYTNFNSLESVSIKRHILCNCGNRVIKIHGFCDSAQAYCAVVYLKILCSHGVKVNLWAGKCRVAPMKDLSIPRLELLACVLLLKLLVSVVNTVRLEVHVRNVFCWTDSQVAVWWIKHVNKRWHVWVQNRVEIIRNNISSDHWFHVSSSQNPADIATCSIPLHIIYHLSWQKGPSFLLQSVEYWLSQDFISLS